MADVGSPEKRSRMMAGIRGKDTKPELIVRHGLHARGFRYRLHAKNLPGKPDIVFPKYRAVIFVHGCFWHGHDCHLFKWPKSREEFWRKKIEANRLNDAITVERIRDAGWRVLVIWECLLKGRLRLETADAIEEVARWLSGDEVAGVLSCHSREANASRASRDYLPPPA